MGKERHVKVSLQKSQTRLSRPYLTTSTGPANQLQTSPVAMVIAS